MWWNYNYHFQLHTRVSYGCQIKKTALITKNDSALKTLFTNEIDSWIIL